MLGIRWERLQTIARSRWIAVSVTVLGVLLAVLRMGRIAATSSHMQYADYWPMLDSLLTPDGSIRWRGVLEARNEHPIVVPKLLYILNVGLTDGDNHGQVAIDLVLALVLVGLVALIVRATPGMGRVARVAMIVMSAFVVLAPQGTWSYVKAMSGTAWLSANVFIVGALAAQQRRHIWLACGLGTLACVSYGTGLAVWPALVVAGVLVHGRRWQAQWPVWATGTVVTALYGAWYLSNRTPGMNAPTSIRGVLTNAGWLLVGGVAGGGVGIVVGIVVAGLVAAALWTCRDRLVSTAPWVGMVVYAVGAALLIGRSRGLPEAGGGAIGGALPSRYWTVVAWVWIGVAGLGVVALRDRSWRVAAPLVLLAAVLAGGRDVPESLRSATETADLLAAAMQMDVADGTGLHGGFGTFPEVTDKVRARDHYPFDGSFDMGCGLLGEQVEVAPETPDNLRGSLRIRLPKRSPGIVRYSGRIRAPHGHLECVVVVDAGGTVVGTGPIRTWGDPLHAQVRALAPADLYNTVAVRMEPDGPFYPLPVRLP